MLLRLICASLVLALGTLAASAQTRLVISVYGISQDSFRKHLYGPFEATCGCKIVVELGNSSERLAKLEARKDNPEIDMAVFTDFNALEAAQKGLIEPLDVAKLTNFDKLYPAMRDPVGNGMAVGYTLYATGIAHRSDKVKIGSWKDLWAPELKRRFALPGITTSQGPMMLAMIEGSLGGKAPDFGTAIDKIAASKADIVTFYERSAQLVQLFQQDEIHAAVTGKFNWPLFARLGMPIAWAKPAEGDSGGMNVMVMVKGTRNKELVHRFMDFWLSADVQTKIAMDLVDSPANADVKLPPQVASELTYGESVKAIRFIPPQQVLDNRAAWLAGWNQKIAR